VTPDAYQQAGRIDPATAMVLLTDCQPGLALAAGSRPQRDLVDNVAALVRLAGVFEVPVVATSSATARFGGHVWPAVADLLASATLERTVFDAYLDEHVRAAIDQTGRSTVLVAGLLSEACVSFTAMSLRNAGREVLVVADCCAGITAESHQLALQRVGAAGIGVTSWIQVLLEWQQDWTHSDTYPGATSILTSLGGAYGLALLHAWDMLASPAAHPAQGK
jgi:nicotinamidase-related amidase